MAEVSEVKHIRLVRNESTIETNKVKNNLGWFRYLDKAISLQEADSNILTELGRYYDQF